MTNEQLLLERWEDIDKLLLVVQKNVKMLSSDLANDIVMLYQLMQDDLTYLLKKPTKEEQDLLDKRIKEWKKKKYLTGLFKYRVETRKNTRADMFLLLLMGLYVEKFYVIDEITKESFEKVVQISTKKAYSDRNIKQPIRNHLDMQNFLYLPLFSTTWTDYIIACAISDSEELYKQFIALSDNSKEKNINKQIKDKINKQFNRLININEENGTLKESGSIVNQTFQISNQAYLEPFKEEDNLMVRFVATIDKRTTKMCKSLNNQLFYVNKINKYKRYSDIDEREVEYTTMGLQVGQNLPPIDNHFHYCRSTITYLIGINFEMKPTPNKQDHEQFEKYRKHRINMTDRELTDIKLNDPKEYERLKKLNRHNMYHED